jgi:hypothetical protein
MVKEELHCEDDYDDYEITSLSDLFRLIELRLKEARRLSSLYEEATKKSNPLVKVMDPKKFLKNAYNEALNHARNIKKANPKLIEIPPPTPNDEQNLINLRDWCTDSRRQKADRTSEERWLKVKEIAELVGKTPGRITQLCNENKIACKGTQKSRLVDSSSALLYFAKKQAEVSRRKKQKLGEDAMKDAADIERDARTLNKQNPF